jgi:ketosteroid isomerase-like protein
MQIRSVNSVLKVRPALLAVAQLVVLALAGVALGQQADTTPQQEVRAVFDRMVGAAQNGDDAALAKFFDQNATFIDGSGFNRGFHAYLDKARTDRSKFDPAKSVGGNDAHSQLANYSVSDVEVTAEGSVAWVTYRYSLSANAGGKTASIAGFGTIIFRLAGAEWKVAHSQTAGKVVG